MAAVDYPAYFETCEGLRDVRLPGLNGQLDVAALASSQTFGIFAGTLPSGWKSVLRRYLASGVTFKWRTEARASAPDVMFLFTSDGRQRPDYVDELRAVADASGRGLIASLDLESTAFGPRNLSGLVLIPIWAFMLRGHFNCLRESWDVAASIFRAMSQARALFKLEPLDRFTGVVAFCDEWSVESAVIQSANIAGLDTATLQHGNGIEVFCGTQAKHFLCNSLSSAANARSAGVPSERVVPLFPMKYVGRSLRKRNGLALRRLGVVFDNDASAGSNLSLLGCAHSAARELGLRCCVRFHPSNDRSRYALGLEEGDAVYDDLASFEEDVDVCLVYNSSMFTDLVFLGVPVYRYRDGKKDLFPTLGDETFSSAAELISILNGLSGWPEASQAYANRLYSAIYGEGASRNGYERFFERFGKASR